MTANRCGIRRTWPYFADYLLVLALFVLHLFSMHAVASVDPAAPWPPDWRILLDVAAIGPLAVRQRLPRTVFLVVTAAQIVIMFAWYDDQIIGFAMLIALYTVQVRSKLGWAGVAVVVTGAVAMIPVVRDPNILLLHGLLYNGAFVGTTTALGQIRRLGIRRAEQLQRAREQLAEEAVMVERTRIARELHDIVAHGISVIAVRAGVARALLPGDPAQAQEAIAVIENVARESLTEMRHMLGALRSSAGTQAEESGPQPGLDRLDELVRAAEASGLAVDVVRDGAVRTLPPGQDLAAYRIVQEALTNAVKHAGPVRSTATLRYLPDRLVIEVFNEAGVTTPRLPRAFRGGHGLIGMRERAALYGGTVCAAAVDGGFRVTAELPAAAAVTG